MTRSRRDRALAAVLSGALLVLAASCNEDEISDRDRKVAATTTSSSTTTTVAPPVGKPQRIVSLSPSVTEVLFAIGAGEQVVAVDSLSTYPPEAPLSDLSSVAPDPEAIVSYAPDLVITEGEYEQLTEELNALGIAVVAIPTPRDLNRALEQMERIGAITGNIAEAARMVADLEARVAAVRSSIDDKGPPIRYYFERTTDYDSLTTDTFMGSLLAEFGLESIADAVDTARTDGYPRLEESYILEADPDVIFLADIWCCQQTVESVAERPGWEFLQAVVRGQVVPLDDDVASRWGPRTVDLFEQIAAALVGVEPAVELES